MPLDLLQEDLLWVQSPPEADSFGLQRPLPRGLLQLSQAATEQGSGSAGSLLPIWGSSEEQLLLRAFGLAEIFSELYCSFEDLPPQSCLPAVPRRSRI